MKSIRQIDVSFFYASVLLVIDEKLRHDIVRVAVEARAASEYFRGKAFLASLGKQRWRLYILS